VITLGSPLTGHPKAQWRVFELVSGSAPTISA
jgi:hypothetical protein